MKDTWVGRQKAWAEEGGASSSVIERRAESEERRACRSQDLRSKEAFSI